MKKRILITGGATGIGKNLIKHFLSNNETVIFVSRSENNVKETHDELASVGGSLFPFAGDLSSSEFCKTFQKDLEKIGDINYLINCAGVQGEISAFVESNLDNWYSGFMNNVSAVLNSISILLPSMVNSNYGKIITLSGGGATGPRPNFSSYAASKIAIVRFSEILAVELLGNHIDVNVISPGACNTRMMDDILNAGSKAGEKEISMAREIKRTGGTPFDKIASLVSFLCSKDSDGITGKIISALWDEWYDSKFQERLRNDSNFATLRRIDGKNH